MSEEQQSEENFNRMMPRPIDMRQKIREMLGTKEE